MLRKCKRGSLTVRRVYKRNEVFCSRCNKSLIPYLTKIGRLPKVCKVSRLSAKRSITSRRCAFCSSKENETHGDACL
nr:MAG TPA: hypothetical protein [Caudoviricetes sp.]